MGVPAEVERCGSHGWRSVFCASGPAGAGVVLPSSRHAATRHSLAPGLLTVLASERQRVAGQIRPSQRASPALASRRLTAGASLSPAQVKIRASTTPTKPHRTPTRAVVVEALRAPDDERLHPGGSPAARASSPGEPADLFLGERVAAYESLWGMGGRTALMEPRPFAASFSDRLPPATVSGGGLPEL